MASSRVHIGVKVDEVFVYRAFYFAVFIDFACYVAPREGSYLLGKIGLCKLAVIYRDVKFTFLRDEVVVHRHIAGAVVDVREAQKVGEAFGGEVF